LRGRSEPRRQPLYTRGADCDTVCAKVHLVQPQGTATACVSAARSALVSIMAMCGLGLKRLGARIG
jgi:hypothetical protein